MCFLTRDPGRRAAAPGWLRLRRARAWPRLRAGSSLGAEPTPGRLQSSPELLLPRFGLGPWPPTGRWVLFGLGLCKALKVNPPGRRAARALGDQRRGRAAGWRRRGASRGEFPEKAELVPSFLCISLHPANWWLFLSVRVVFGRGKDAEVIGLIRLGTAQISVLDCSARWAQFLSQKGRVIDAQLCPARQPGDPRAQSARVCKACLVVRRRSSMTSFLFRQDSLGAVPPPSAPRG